MQFRTPSNKYLSEDGITYMEVVLVLGIAVFFLVSIITLVNPVEAQRRKRDEKRLSDIAYLDSAINNYALDNQGYPALDSALFTSNTLPGTGTNLALSSAGWIDEDISDYAEKLPLDPLNDDTFFYSYIHDDVSYELNAVLESYTDEMTSDGGNDPARYEMGNNLLLISP